MTDLTHPQFILVDEKQPPPRQTVVVVCPEFRRLGFLDEQGVWRHGKDRTPIEDRLVSAERLSARAAT